jgi:arginase
MYGLSEQLMNENKRIFRNLGSTLILVFSAIFCAGAVAQVPVAIVVNPYAGDRAGPAIDIDAQTMLERAGAQGTMIEVITASGGDVRQQDIIALTAADEAQYGRWNRFGLASGHLADQVAANARNGLLNIGLYNNCSSLMGMLGGLRHSADTPLRVGLVWIDAHGDYNTPETTMSGMLGGMPVAIATGDALTRMRIQAGLDEPLSKSRLVMVGVRDLDRLEAERVEEDQIPQISTADVREVSENLRTQMQRLTDESDIVYVHVDLDVLDPAEVSGHPLTVPDGPTGAELGNAIRVMFQYPKTYALGIASYPHENDPGLLTLQAIHDMVAGALEGIAQR